MRDLKHCAVLALTVNLLGGCAANLNPTAELTTASTTPPPAKALQGTRVKSDENARVFVMAGLGPDCNSTKIPMITVDKAPTKGTVTFIAVPETTVQFSVSGQCVGKRVPGVGIYYKAHAGQSGPDVFTVVARSGTRELASRTIPVEIAQ
jgi:hypothetical protein